MKILFVNHYAGQFGGVEVYVRRTARALSERGHQCDFAWIEASGNEARTVPSAPGEPSLQGLSGSSGPDTTRSESLQQWLSVFAWNFQAGDDSGIADMARTRGYDCIFLHKVDRVAPYLALAPGVRIVRYMHDHDTVCPRRHKYYAWNSRICERSAGFFCFLDAGFVGRVAGKLRFSSPLRFFSELADNRKLPLVLSGSRAMERELRDNGFDPSRLAILPPVPPSPDPSMPGSPAPEDPRIPVNASTGEPSGTAAGAASGTGANSSDTHPYVLYVGQLIRGKGVDLLIQAFAPLVAADSGLRLRIAGTGNAAEGLKQLASGLCPPGKVVFEGSVPYAGLQDLYRNARVLAVPSRWPEPFGMIGLEAMSHSLPIVGFASGGIPDWLRDGENGILVKSGDVSAFSSALHRLLEDPQLARNMGRSGKAFAAREFNYKETLDRLEQYLAGPAGQRTATGSSAGGCA